VPAQAIDAFAKTPANHVPLTPLSFLARTADIYPDRIAVMHGSRRYSWRQTMERCRRLASALRKHGIGPGDTVAVIAANTPEMVEAHYGVAMAGAVLNTINVRLDPDTIAYILAHGEAKALITDTAFAATAEQALGTLDRTLLVIDIDDSEAPGGCRLGTLDYEALLAAGDPEFDWRLPEDEWQALALNYTSGTSGRPKGVVYHHRGAYLMAMGTAVAWEVPRHPRYLYVVPMFHCNGWCHVWTMTLMAGTIVCCRTVNAPTIFNAIAEHRIDHVGGAPIVLSLLINAPPSERRPFDWHVKVMTAGAPPPAAVLAAMDRLGFDVMQVYGLTETYGHVVQCAWQDRWNDLPFEARAEIKARQGVRFPMTEGLRVVEVGSDRPVAADGQSMGEVQMRGNTVMKGYFKNPGATAEAFAGGWFHSGDLAVVHPEGYIEIRDRLKDVIISGGENISSVEVEAVLYRHPAVAHAAVVARPDEKWGEAPCAFVELKDGAGVAADELIAFTRQHIAGFKAPRTVVFGELPKTATGKIQKFMLRERARSL